MHTDACKQYCDRPSLRVQLQVFRRLPFLASASRKLRLCRAQCASRSASDKQGARNAHVTTAKASPEIEPTSLFGKQVCADLIRSSQIPPPRQPVWRVIKTLPIIGADTVERGGGASQVLRDSARYSDNCLQRAGLTCGTAPSLWPGPDSSPLQTRRCPPHALFSQVSAADQKQIKLRENNKNAPSDNYATHIQCIRLQLRIGTSGPLYRWEHEIYFTFSWKLSSSQTRRDPLSGRLSLALHFAAV
ncbi:Hypothetical_protein [Hexamita inflata]|uniref:Hypothetical_protein n=1 Tax=Hexamita inflata TaxID=28002 RepID=A0AA86VC56_9EUKA|nr:Hypothetical protein HINF_LOCUS50163 [Hexamita inflata]